MKVLRSIGIAALTGALLGAVLFIEQAWGSRNASGTMSSYNGPYVAGTVISSAALNARFSDLETELTDSLSRSAKGGMLAALRGTDGTSTAPAYSFTSETTAGLERAGAGDLRMCFNGTCPQKWLSTGVAVTGTATVSSTLDVTGVTTTTGGLKMGSTGTTVGALYHGTTSWTPGSLLSLSGTTTTVSLSGATAGARCFLTWPGSMNACAVFDCWVTSNTCNLQAINLTTGTCTPTSGTYGCTVLNP